MKADLKAVVPLRSESMMEGNRLQFLGYSLVILCTARGILCAHIIDDMDMENENTGEVPSVKEETGSDFLILFIFWRCLLQQKRARKAQNPPDRQYRR